MLKKRINKKYYAGAFYVEYNNKEYNIEYDNKDNVILKRLSDNKILDVFSDRELTFIVQYKTETEGNFLVTTYFKKEDKSEKDLFRFSHYTTLNTRRSFTELDLKNCFDCYFINQDTDRITDKTFLIRQPEANFIYNIEKQTKSKNFNYVYLNGNVRKYFKDNTILVDEVVIQQEIIDTLTYGINPETFKITTPIWSSLQQRFINIYTKEQVEKIQKELLEKVSLVNNENLDEITIYFEVIKYLERLYTQFSIPNKVYIDNNKVNEEFVRKFVK